MFNIEIMSSKSGLWTFYESLEDCRANVIKHVKLIQCSFPNYSVRAIESDSGQLLRPIDREV